MIFHKKIFFLKSIWTSIKDQNKSKDKAIRNPICQFGWWVPLKQSKFKKHAYGSYFLLPLRQPRSGSLILI